MWLSLVVCLIFVNLCSCKNYCQRAEDQLLCYKQWQNYSETDILTTVQGQPLYDAINAKTVGERGPMLLEDTIFLKELAQFDRERIPERVVHAKGAGAHGYFEPIGTEIQKYTKAIVFSEKGRTKIFVRFSQVAGELGAPDTTRDVRGFAIKFYTEDGIWDIVGNNLPVFFIREPRLFPSFIHTQKRNPQTHLHDQNMAWDFYTLRNESMLQVMHLYSNLGTPASYRQMNGFGVHTFKLVNVNGESFYCKFNYESDQGVKNLTGLQAERLRGTDPDYLIKDLYDAIARQKYPSWTMHVQIMTMDQANSWKYNPFDTTKLWPKEEFPYIKVGRFVLNRNPASYFMEVEQSAFSPANMISGIEPSPEKLLQGRLFSYLDTQYYRLGVNFNRLPINQPPYETIAPVTRDGYSAQHNFDAAPNYFPNSFMNTQVDPAYKESSYKLSSMDVNRHEFDTSADLVQPGELYRSWSSKDQEHVVTNLAKDLQNVFSFIQKRATSVLSAIDEGLGKKVEDEIKECRKRGHRYSQGSPTIRRPMKHKESSSEA